MPDISEKLEAILQSLPHKPGIYLHKDAEGVVLYVGKAGDLRQRVRSYFVDSSDLSPKNRALVATHRGYRIHCRRQRARGVDPRK